MTKYITPFGTEVIFSEGNGAVERGFDLRPTSVTHTVQEIFDLYEAILKRREEENLPKLTEVDPTHITLQQLERYILLRNTYGPKMGKEVFENSRDLF